MSALIMAPPVGGCVLSTVRAAAPAARMCVINACAGRGTERRAFRLGPLHTIGMVCCSHAATLITGSSGAERAAHND